MRKFSLPCPDSIVDHKATNHFIVCEGMGEYAALPRAIGAPASGGDDWAGGSLSQALKMARDGDLSQVAASDAYLEKLESLGITSSRKMWADDVTGALPNVGAYLAGSPLSMRRRMTSRDDSSPIGLIYDGTISGGVTQEQITKRGTIALALVRLLAARRPVELWFMVGIEAGASRKDGGFIFTRIDTTPLDLARAGFALTHPGATRRLGYDAGIHPDGFNSAHGNYSLRWPYSKASLTPEKTVTVASQAIPHLSEMLAIPGLHLTDPMLTDPEAWLRAQVAKYCEGEE